MGMNATDSRHIEYHIRSPDEIEAVLAKRYDGSNCFWISRDNDLYPTLGVLVNEELSYLTYLPKVGDAGFASVGGLSGETRDPVRFSISEYPGDDVFVEWYAVVPVATAVAAVKEFFHSSLLPSSVQWDKL
jgi:hypothetical protein